MEAAIVLAGLLAGVAVVVVIAKEKLAKARGPARK